MSEEPCEWKRLGNTGLKINKTIVGCMSFGNSSWGDWVISDEEKVFAILKRAYDLGLRTFDTANAYSNGASEILLGKFLKKYNIKRDKVVIMTKAFFEIDEDMDLSLTKKKTPIEQISLLNSKGLSAKHLHDAVEGSVRRLGTYIDILQIHRYDHDTPPEETMRTLNTLVEKGLTRYIGASSMYAHEFIEMQYIAEKNGWHKFVSMQNYYHLLYREEEREMIAYCNKTGVGLVPWSPNARGVLTRPVNQTTFRSQADAPFQAFLGLANLTEADKEIVKRVEEIAKKKGVSMAMVASAWVIHKGCSPIVGLSSEGRVEEAVQATHLKLTDEEATYLEEPYLPKKVVGISVS